jgi:hypothetical protein
MKNLKEFTAVLLEYPDAFPGLDDELLGCFMLRNNSKIQIFDGMRLN